MSEWSAGPWWRSAPQTVRDAHGHLVARMNWQNGPANGCLTAAAPELYEALVCMRQHLALFCGPDDAIANAIFREADTVLRKARGETDG